VAVATAAATAAGRPVAGSICTAAKALAAAGAATVAVVVVAAAAERPERRFFSRLRLRGWL
jgi:hypothetical protein